MVFYCSKDTKEIWVLLYQGVFINIRGISVAFETNLALARLPPQGEKAEISAHFFLNNVSALLPVVPESPLICRTEALFITSWRG